MRNLAVTVLTAVAALSLSACVTNPAVSSYLKLDPQTTNQCKAHCDALGMDLGAVVIIRNSAGCVCEPRGKPAASTSGASAIAGGAAIVMAREEAARHNQSRR